AQLHVILRRTDDWKYRGKSTSLLFRIAGSLSVEKSISIASVAGADTLQSDRVLESLFTGYH
ncbi:hypothetical protein, partial [Escherichia coli]|uniref:hypothetical protein n=1 Tax=Escherichia coli TaxID=562 RepID=UPI000931BBE0